MLGFFILHTDHSCRAVCTHALANYAAVALGETNAARGSGATPLCQITPLSNVNELFDHLVGAREDSWGQLEAHSAGSAKINSQIKLCRTFKRQVAWLCTFKNSIKLRNQVTSRI